jgi:arsenite oxidase small subunit
MKRRTFIEIASVSGCAAACTAAGPAGATSEGAPKANTTRAELKGPSSSVPAQAATRATARTYERCKLVDADGKAIKVKSLKANHNYVFNYPFEGTPCFLLNLDQSLAAGVPLQTESGAQYDWKGGVGPKQSLVAYSAICAHKLAYPSPQVSFIGFRLAPSPASKRGKVITCCADKSVYDPYAGAKVMSGPAPQPLATILLEYDAKTDEVFAVGTFGGEKFDEFFQKYAFKLSLEKGGSGARSLAKQTTVLRDLATHSQQTAQC